MVEVLRTSPTLRPAPARRALARMLAHALNRTFSTDESATQLVEEHLAWIVARCLDQVDETQATDALAHAVGTVTGDKRIMAQLRLIADRQQARNRLGEDELNTLMALLSCEEVPDARALAQACLHPLAAHLPVHCTDAPSVVLHLLRRNALPDGLPPFLAFLEHLAAVWQHPSRTELHAWTDRHARSQGLYEQLQQCRRGVLDRPTFRGENREARVMFVLLPDGLDDDYCILRVWHEDSLGKGMPPTRDADARVPRRDLGVHVHDRLQQALTRVGQAPALTVEFWLPAQLANLPVAQWCRPGPDDIWQADYRVVVRSLDRLAATSSHDDWKRRWEQLIAGQPPAGVPLACPGQRHTGPQPRVQLLVLDAPPDKEEGLEQLLKGIHSGAPAILWHRSDCSSHAFRQWVDALVGQGSLADLPARLGELQHKRKGLETDAVSDLTLLWDDPNRPLPVVKALTSPDEVVTQ
ncbi:hypothetical protein ACGF3J_38425 [Streptomyces sp. NPDC048171]|uniref:VMAP-C domain-containing protein n=1 Tax=Streptomyces sp. NPDC048171 TaxID=3365504 RepID=UPI003710235B